MQIKFDTLIMKTPADFLRLQKLHGRIAEHIPYGKLIFVGNAEVVRLAEESGDARITAVDEDTLLPFDKVHACIREQMEPLLQGRDLPRGVTGWYYQQFLKWEYARYCKDEYYLVWDGDTIPCRPLSMFQEGSGKPYLDLKHEFHEPYFRTIGKILPGMRKVIGRSFISEHMLINREICLKLMEEIESNEVLPGTRFWEKIIRAIPAEEIQNSAFSEFETYGTYVALRRSDAYRLRDWHSFRLGGEFFDPMTISERDFQWLAKDFDAISFEKGMSVREDHRNLFDNPDYQAKLTPRQMLEAAQGAFRDGYIEVWGEPETARDTNVSKNAFEDNAPETEKLKYLREDSWRLYEALGDAHADQNRNQAYLCYEKAAFLCEGDAAEKERLQKKAGQLKEEGDIRVRPVAIVILSHNNLYLMQKCLESIRTHCNPDSCGVVVLDNASTDGTADWLKTQDDISLLLSDENLGFPQGCNEAIRTVREDADILLLNNDTRMTPNALFWLRMALYEDERNGACGAVSNYTDPTQRVDVTFSFPEEYVAYGAENNIPGALQTEPCEKLSGFAMLIRREALDRTGLFDERFSPGYFEDTDLCIRLKREGYRLLLCKNSFIYHAGSQSFLSRDDVEALFERNYQYACLKWGKGTIDELFPKQTEAAEEEADASRIKLIIWDLDDTFWTGILSEEQVKLKEDALALARRAVEIGVMNSICSKNDPERVREALEHSEAGNLWELFVFPSVDWNPKAGRVRHIIEDMALRPENVLFLDDSDFNRREVKYELPDIMIGGEELIGRILAAFRKAETADPEHKRLAQYRVLEKKQKDRGRVGSNEDFLRASDIRVTIERHCEPYLDRIAEMVKRTNQLNYTKIQSSEEELRALIASDEISSGVVRVSDRYGDYGIVGFYALDLLQDHLIHFLFSCRTLGMGVEQYLYRKLGFPSVDVSGEVASPLNKEITADWIREESAQPGLQPVPEKERAQPDVSHSKTAAGKTAQPDLFIKGPCDMDQIIEYLKQGTDTPLYLETNFVDERGVVAAGFNNLLHLKEASLYTEEELQSFLEAAPFLSRDDFMTDMFAENHRVVFFSMLSETHAGIYRHKESGFRICFSSCNFDLTDPDNEEKFISGEYTNHNFPFTQEIIGRFREQFVFEQSLPPEEITELAGWLRDKLPAKTMLVLLLGSGTEAEPNTAEFAGHAERYRELNRMIKDAFRDRDDIRLIDVTELIDGPDCFEGCTNHFSRKVYHGIAVRFAEIVNGL